MPMLTTVRMRLPVKPCQAPLRTRVAKSAMRVQDGVHFWHDIHTVHDRCGRLWARAEPHGAPPDPRWC